jgi:cytochrome P450
MVLLMPKVTVRKREKPSLPPGPRLPVTLQALNWTFRPGPFLERCQQDHGDVFTLRLEMSGAPKVFIADPRLAAALMTIESLSGVPSSRAAIKPVFGDESVVMADGEVHKRGRQAMIPAFRGRHLDRYREMVVSATDREIDSWPLGRAFPMRPRLQAMALEMILDVVFGNRDSGRREELGKHINRLLAAIGNSGGGFVMSLPGWLRAMGAARLVSWRENFDTTIREEISSRQEGSWQGHDALSHLMAAGDLEGEPLSVQSICDQVCTLLLAGHETTATSLAWSIEHLVHDPQAFDRLNSEVESGPDGGERYANAVVTESLRLNPPLPNTQRKLTAPAIVGDYMLPSDTDVAVCGYLIHRRPEVYRDPLAFKPERFLDVTPAQEIWWPFGGGSRRCIGANFARFQMNLILRRIFERTHLQAAEPDRRESIRKRGILSAPSRGTRVVMTERLPA